MRVLFCIALFSLLLTKPGLSYPQMLSHGYASCTACHISPTGGGILTPYGRSLSREVLSQSGLEGEENALYGAVSPPPWLQVGGDLRVLQSYLSNQMVEQAKFTVMQADVELGVVNEHWQLVGTVGYQNAMSANSTRSPFLSRRHFVQYTNAEGDYFRVGKFDLAYGIRWPDHFMFSRRDLSWDEGSEAYRAEWTRVAEKWEATLSASVGRPEAPELMVDKNVAGRMFYSVGDAAQVGVSAYYGANDAGPRWVAGPAAALTLIKNVTLFGQLDFQRMLGERRGEQLGIVQSLRINYEPFQGIHLFALQEYSRLDLESERTAKNAYTLGFQWFARPHVEFSGAVRKQTSAVSMMGANDSAWMMMHYYL